MNEEVIGRGVPRVDAVEKVTGRAVYGVDLKMRGMLHAKVLRSPIAHGRVLNVDTSKAERLPGVKAVATGKDLVGRYGAVVQDQHAYCGDKVRYIGDPVAGVAAVDEDTALQALALIKVDYEELPPVLDPFRAMEPGAPLVHEELGRYWVGPMFHPVAGTNICNHFKLRKGDVEEGFRRSDFIAEHTFTTPAIQHCHLEPHVCIAQCDPAGRVTIWSSTQHPYTVRREMARLLDLPLNRVRVVVPWVGGGFGGKVGVKAEPLCVALAMKVKGNRPVKITLTREEEFHATAIVRHASTIRIRAGVRRDGTLEALKTHVVLDSGAYADAGPVVARSMGMASSGPYRLPNVWSDVYCVYTNKVIAGAFRGLGTPQLMWAVESMMDILAEGIGLDPVELRLRNALVEGDVSATGQTLHSVGIKECISRAAQAIGWGKKLGPNRGIGFGTLYKMTQTPSSSAAFVKLSEDGSAEVLASTVDMGQGSSTVLAQIAAQELGLDVSTVRVVAPDTDVTPFDHGTASSRSTFHMGNAVRQAAVDARTQLFEIAAEVLEASPHDLEARGGCIYVKGVPQGLPISQIPMGVTYGKGKPVIGRGTYSVPDATPLDPDTGQGTYPAVFWLYGAQAAEVLVDPATGKVEVLKLVSAHDVGRVINPLNCRQQVEGAAVMGLGYALMEELVLEDGKPVNMNFTDYRIPTALDIPETIPIFVESRHEHGPYGAKGVGEPALAPTAPAIGNAIYRAIGVRITDLPITPEKVLRALKEKADGKT